MKLTQEQKQDLIKISLCAGQAKEILADIATKIHPQDIDDLIDAAYALGVADGKAVGAAEMRELCVKVCEDIDSSHDCYGERVELACAEAIRALAPYEPNTVTSTY